MTVERRFHKNIRLPDDRYRDEGSVFIATVVTEGRKPILVQSGFARVIVETFAFQYRTSSQNPLVYSIMPDHFHLVVQIEEAGLIDLMRNFKSWTTKKWQEQTGEARLWQKSFNDHGIRRTEDIDTVVNYVIQNPIRDGLVEDWQDWPWTGGALISISGR